MRPSTWYEAISRCQQRGQAYVIVTVLASAGSTPRDTGAKMIVTGDELFDTIGGGHLEFETSQFARELLAANTQMHKIVAYPLSSRLGQCCGGAVKILYEVHVNHHQHVAIFGAGHVAQALVPILAQLPLQITWVDNREDFVANMHKSAAMLPNLVAVNDDEPCQILENLASNTWVVILTHNHQLDYELVESALRNTYLGFIGMIGSQTKAKRFVTKLAHRGFSGEQIARLISPIGDISIPGKRPVEVAVSICAQLIRLLHSQPQAHKLAAVNQTKLLEAQTSDTTSKTERSGDNS